MKFWLFYFSIFFVQHQAFAIELKFGPEFTVSSDEMLECQKDDRISLVSNASYRALHCKNQVIAIKYKELHELWRSQYIAWAQKGQELQEEIRELMEERRKFFLTKEAHGAWLGVDPGVLEMGHTPMTIAQIEQHQKLFQSMFFDDPKKIGLEPKWFTGGGHINIGLEEFRKNPLLLINFMRDLYNHPELTMGVFGYDTNNALSIRQIQKNPYIFDIATQRLAEKIGQKWKYFISELLNIIAPNTTDIFMNHWNASRQEQKTSRKGMYSVLVHRTKGQDRSSDRIEIRAVRPQASMGQWIRMVKLLESRVQYLKQFDHLIPIEKDQVDIKREGLAENLIENPPVDPQKSLQRFYQYVTESGESWLDHQDYLWPQWHIDGEIIKFNNMKMKTCEDFLSI